MSKKLLLLTTAGFIGAGILAIQPALAHFDGPAENNAGEVLLHHKTHREHMKHKGMMIAECLNLSPEELQSLRQEGKSLNDIVEEQNLNEEDLFQCLEEHHTTHLQEMIDEGKLTEDQINKIKERHENHMQHRINKFLN